jgi:hypothetical protein
MQWHAIRREFCYEGPATCAYDLLAKYSPAGAESTAPLEDSGACTYFDVSMGLTDSDAAEDGVADD